MSKRLSQYSGPLAPSQIAEGINTARRNAKRLVEDARALLSAKRHVSALALAILAIEETGKTSILRELSYAQDPKAVRAAWRRYRSHTSKNVLWMVPALIRHGARSIEDFAQLFDDGADPPHVLEQLKQVALYSDCLGSAHWSLPEAAIDVELATSIVRVAELFAKGAEITTEEVELWVKIMGPVLRVPAPLPVMRKALAEYYAEAAQRGFAEPMDDVSTRFIWGPTTGVA